MLLLASCPPSVLVGGRAYYRCTQRGTGCRAKKTVDTALKGANEVRITYDGGHNHDPEREVLEGVMVVSITDAKGRAHAQGATANANTNASTRAAPASPAQPMSRPALGVPTLPGPGHGDGGKRAAQMRASVEVRQRKQRKVVLVDEDAEAQGAVARGANRKFKVVDGEGEDFSGDEGGRQDTNDKHGHGAFDGLASPQFMRRFFDGPVGSHAGGAGAHSSPLGKPQAHRPVALAQEHKQGAQRLSKDPFQEHQERFLEQLASQQRWAGDDAGQGLGHASGSPRSDDSAVLEQLSPGHGQRPTDGGPGVPALFSDKKLGRLSDFSLCGTAADARLPEKRQVSGGLDLDLKL